LWDSKTCKKLKGTNKSGVKNGVECISFSPNGEYIGLVGIDAKTSVLRTKTLNKVHTEKNGGYMSLDLKWSGENSFITVGPKALFVWTFDNKKLTKKRGRMKDIDEILLCC
jgi:WD40 repeat protein